MQTIVLVARQRRLCLGSGEGTGAQTAQENAGRFLQTRSNHGR